MRMYHIGAFRNDCGKTDMGFFFSNVFKSIAGFSKFFLGYGRKLIVKCSMKLQQNCLDFNYTYGCCRNSNSYVNLIEMGK